MHSSASPRYAPCIGDRLHFEGSKDDVNRKRLKKKLEKAPEAGNPTATEQGQIFWQATVLSAPCAKSSAGACCNHNVFFRPGTTDFGVYDQIFIAKQLRFLYALFENQPPRYILDAGANAGFSTSLFKLLWPDAVVVSVEPNPNNFEALKKNTAVFEDVHPINAGLWDRKAKIGQIAKHGEWGFVFKEADESDLDGMQAYGVWDLAKMHDIPSFDLIKIDIEGAEGQVFAPGADISWIDKASVVSLEIHDDFHGYFNLGETEISSRVAKAFNKRPYAIATDNEHTIFAKYDLLETLL
ncbi:hypothetical protein Ndes2526B_g07402 [Nannochloris sp. 'desiccata']